MLDAGLEAKEMWYLFSRGLQTKRQINDQIFIQSIIITIKISSTKKGQGFMKKAQ